MPYKDPEKGREAARKASQRWREKHPEKVKAVQAAFYDRHRDKLRAKARAYAARHRDEHCAKSRAWYHANKDHVRAKHQGYMLRTRYGLTAEQFAALGTVCGICSASEDGRVHKGTKTKFRLAVDHDHETTRVRGVLCGNCNTGIGLFKHDPALLRKAIEYLERV